MPHDINAKVGTFVTSTNLVIPGSVGDFIDLHRQAPLVLDEIRQAAGYLLYSLEVEFDELDEQARTGNNHALAMYRGRIETAKLLSELIRDRVGAWMNRN